jgi:hypothetical protein
MLLTVVVFSVHEQQSAFGYSEYGHCPSKFAGMYGWLSFRNTCSETIHITFCSPKFGCSAMTLDPGREASTGRSMREWDDLSIAVCKTADPPIDDQGKYWKGFVNYRCRL